ncbi:P-loop containing nucleoside triphosphate hydrolase protein [Mycena venus]|uniref:DNA 3'-5' helicase n=1 Tax=Mycena venus TaxID=2733690 RepID=A0A8H6Z488_9AGAR|nr:P-loop containing nucleoside triphosphate hydrolase protein [Mycena venus]
MICVDPEHLRHKAWREITSFVVYRTNLVYGCVEDAHLINIWGADFRPDFKHIGGFFRGRLPSYASITALSATLQPGLATKSVFSSLGMLGNNFHIFWSTNERPNTQFIMEPLEMGVGGKIFPQLLRHLNSRQKAVIHCRTIDDIFRVFICLWKALPPGPHRLRPLKMYHSLRSFEDNEEILQLLDEDPECQIVIATIAFANGLDVKALLDSISLGFPDTVDQLWQEKGRIGGNSETAARGVVLFQPSSLAAAENQIAASSAANLTGDKTAKALKSKRQPKPLEHAKALLLTEKECYIATLNRIYQNPPLETTTLDCITAQRPDKKLKLAKKEHKKAESTLADFGETVRQAERKNRAHQNQPRSSFFPTSVIRALLDDLSFDSLEKLEPVLQSWIYAAGYRVRLYAVVHTPRTTINSRSETARIERNANQRATRQKKKKKDTYVSESEGEMEDEGEDEQLSTDEKKDAHPRSSPIPPSPKPQRGILEEVTDANNSTHSTTKRAPRKPLQCAAEDFLTARRTKLMGWDFAINSNLFYFIFTFTFTLRLVTLRLFVLFVLFFFLHLGTTQPFQGILELLRLIPIMA